MTRPGPDGKSLVALLLAPPPGTPTGGPAIAVLPAQALPPTELASAPAAAGTPAGSRLAAPLMLAARAVLRRPRVRQLALRILKRFPALYARAYRMLLQGGPGAGEAAGEAAPSSLSPRGQRLYRLLRRLQAAARTPAAAGARRKLAFVCPMPPQRTGIASYAVELLPELMDAFEIELVVDQPEVVLPAALAGLPVRQAAWFVEHGAQYDQVLYQFGNSPFHSHMFALLARHPGVVVLHDFFLGGALAHAQMSGAMPRAWQDALFHAHGYAGVRQCAADEAAGIQVHKAWPASLGVLDGATRTIVHSRHARQLAQDWYGPQAVSHIDVIPHPRKPPAVHDRAAARAALGIGDDVFLVCSFGFVAPNKLVHELLEAWLSSHLARDPRCALVLVGANHDSPYGMRVDEIVRGAGPEARIRIAGWCDDDLYRTYLQAADVGVQLRANAHGESSGAVLDCLNYGLATIVNANGSMAEFPPDALWQLPDDFAVAELAAALDTLRNDPARRAAMGRNAVALLDAGFRPARCAARYRATLDRAYGDDLARDAALRAALAEHGGSAGGGADDVALEALAGQLAQEQAAARSPRRQLLVDAGTALPALAALLAGDEDGVRVEPVYLDTMGGQARYRYARQAGARLLGIAPPRGDEWVDVAPGDAVLVLAGAEAMAADARERAAILAGWRTRGIVVNLLVRAAPAGADDAAALRMLAAAADRLFCADAALAQQLAHEIA